MSWALPAVQSLQSGMRTQIRPRGNSMVPKIKSGQLVTLMPIPEDHVLEVSDIVLCRVKGKYYIHLISAIQGDRYQISNNKGFVNGWITRTNIFGLVVKIEN